MSRTQPADQFQVGDRVLYVHEGVCTTISGYLWAHRIEGLPEIAGYQLACGIDVSKDQIERLGPTVHYEFGQ